MLIYYHQKNLKETRRLSWIIVRIYTNTFLKHGSLNKKNLIPSTFIGLQTKLNKNFSWPLTFSHLIYIL